MSQTTLQTPTPGGAPSTPSAPTTTTTTPSSPPGATEGDPFAAIQEPHLREWLAAGGHRDVASLARSAYAAESHIGAPADRIVKLPAKSRAEDPDGWRAIDARFGVPEKPDGYGEFKPATGNLAVSADQLSTLDKAMHAAGATPAARNAALDAYHQMAAAHAAAQEAAWQNEVTAGNYALKQQWGEKFAANAKAADRAFEDHFGEKFVGLLRDAGMIDHPILREAGFKLAALTAESGAPPGGDVSGDPTAMTKAAAEAELKRIEAGEDLMRGDPAAIARRVELLNIIHG